MRDEPVASSLLAGRQTGSSAASKTYGTQGGNVTDLESKQLIYLKGFLFLVILLASAGLLYARSPALATACLLALVIWSAARLYYFMFYVIEKYVDGAFRFSGILPFLRYLVAKRKSSR